MSSYFTCNAMPFDTICLCLFFICFHLQSKFRTYADGRNHANSISHGRVQCAVQLNEGHSKNGQEC